MSILQYEGQWIHLEEYLQCRFGLSISHGLSKAAAEKIIAEIKGSNRPGGERPPG